MALPAASLLSGLAALLACGDDQDDDGTAASRAAASPVPAASAAAPATYAHIGDGGVVEEGSATPPTASLLSGLPEALLSLGASSGAGDGDDVNADGTAASHAATSPVPVASAAAPTTYAHIGDGGVGEEGSLALSTASPLPGLAEALVFLGASSGACDADNDDGGMAASYAAASEPAPSAAPSPSILAAPATRGGASADDVGVAALFAAASEPARSPAPFAPAAPATCGDASDDDVRRLAASPHASPLLRPCDPAPSPPGVLDALEDEPMIEEEPSGEQGLSDNLLCSHVSAKL